MMRGQLVNAQVGRALHPQSTAVAGGMTYRPQGGVDQRPRHLSHTQETEGSSPSPASTICPVLTKKGEECRSYPTSTGLCTGHSKSVGHALGELLGGF